MSVAIISVTHILDVTAGPKSVSIALSFPMPLTNVTETGGLACNLQYMLVIA